MGDGGFSLDVFRRIFDMPTFTRAITNGKSTTGRTILKLLEPTGGKILFDGKDITNYSRKQMRPLRQEMQMVFQDPFSSLDPRQTVMQLISEPIIEHKLLKSKSDIEERTLELMRTVGGALYECIPA